jgi:PAS domain S-box-containing protein
MSIRFRTIPGPLITMMMLLLLLCCTPFNGCAHQQLPETAPAGGASLTADEQAWLARHPVIRVGVMPDWPPMNFVDQHGILHGIGADYLKQMNRLLGGRLVPVAAPFKESYSRVQNGQLDALMDITQRPDRELLFAFTRPYISIPHLLVGRKGGPIFRREEDLSDKRVALEQGFYNVNYFKTRYPDITVREYATTSAALRAVSKGEADAYAGNRAVAVHLIESKLLTNLVLMGTLATPRSELQFGVAKGQQQLLSILDKALAAIPLAEREAIAAKWISEPQAKPLDYRQILIIAAIFAGVVVTLLAVVVVVYRRMNRRLQQQTSFWQGLLECTTAGILIVSSERMIVEVNRRLCEMFAYTRDELVGQSVEVLHLDRKQYEHFGQWFRDARANGALTQIEYQFRRKDDSRFWAVISGGALTQPDGTVGVVWSLTDVSDLKQAEETLRAERGHLQALFEYNGTGNLIVSSRRMILKVNQQLCDLFGYREEELVGQNVGTIHVDQEHYENWAPTFQKVRDGKTHLAAEYPMRRKDGSIFWCYLTGVKLQLPDGETGVVWSIIDITERKQGEIALKRLSLAVEQSANIVVITDPDGLIQYVNPRFSEVTGYSSEEAIGKTPRILKSNHHPPEFYADLWQTITSGLPWRGEMLNKTRSGDEFWEQATITPLMDDNGVIINFVAIKELITERKEAEAALQEAKTRAESANRAKTEFLANMSHEIRTPMNGIISMAHLLRMAELNPEQQEYLASLELSSKNLLALINDILDISKVEAGKLELEYADFSLRGSIDEIVASQLPRINQKQLKLQTALMEELPDILVGDSLRFKQIILNLLGNAIKFTEEGSIGITVKPVSRDGTALTLQLQVSDTGIGMSAEVLDRIFTPFEQADSSTTRKYGGTGLGLSICRRLVDLMHGRIWAESQIGQGSSFYVELPFLVHEVQTEPAPPPVAMELDGVKVSPLRILLAEDNLVNARSMSAILLRMGHQVVVADNGQQAFEQWFSRGFDCILMDIQMPVMGGIEATNLIRQMEQQDGRHTPIIALTAHAMRGDRERLLADGFDGYVAKPVDIALLLAELRTVAGAAL